MKIVNKTVISLIACGYMLTATGCLDDRSNFADGSDPIKTTGDKVTNQDRDGDGLTNDDEINKYNTDPDDSDSDDDGLDDGLEKLKIGTDPNSKDSDNDGVSDGIEVVGTYTCEGLESVTEDGFVITAGKKSYQLDGVAPNAVISRDNPISLASWGDKVAANMHHNKFSDPEDKIDALDAYNDSDCDKRPNITETQKENNPLNNKDFYPFIYDTPEGKIMEKKGFVYVPAIDERGGFWIAKKEARVAIDKDNKSIPITNADMPEASTVFKLFTTEGALSSISPSTDNNSHKMVSFIDGRKAVNIYPYDAAFIAQKSVPDSIPESWMLSLPTDRQWTHMVKLIISNSKNNLKSEDKYIVENSILKNDTNVEESYTRSIEELAASNAEWTRTVISKDSNLPQGTESFDADRIKTLFPSWWYPTKNNSILNKDSGIGIYIKMTTRFDDSVNNSNYVIFTRGGADHENLTTEDNGISTADFSFGFDYRNSNIGFRAATDYIK